MNLMTNNTLMNRNKTMMMIWNN